MRIFGYHFIALSDHNILAEGDFWKSIPDQPVNRKAFEDYPGTSIRANRKRGNFKC